MNKILLPLPHKNLARVQYNNPACVGFACSMAQQVKLYGLTNKWIELSPYSIYGFYGNDGDGMSLKYGLEALRLFGALPTYEWDEHGDNPDLHDALIRYCDSNPAAKASASRFKVHNYKQIDGFDEIISELARGNPSVISLKVNRSFGKRRNAIEPIYPGGGSERHAVCVIGCETIDGRDYLIIQNSWGNNGFDGRVYVPRGRYIIEAFALIDAHTEIERKARQIELVIGHSEAIVDGKTVHLDAAPYISGNRTYLPVRFVAESLGASVSWNSKTSTATLNSEESVINVTTHSKILTLNGRHGRMDVAPEIKNGRMMLPIRPIAESLNCNVEWIADENKAVITAI